jgi:hypothetical protein
MVYLCGDNNLSSAGAVDLKEMKKVGSTDRVNVVAQYDRAGHKVQTMRYYLRKKTSLIDDVVARIGETNMGDPKVLEDFVTWATTTYPARHYLLVIWNHGAGWDDANLFEGDVFSGAKPPVSRKGETVATDGARATRGRAVPLPQARAAVQHAHRALFSTTVAQAVTTRGIAFDDDAQDFLDNIEMKRVLAKLTKRLKRKFDILGMDACLMGMAEVSYQLRDAADFTVGSQEEEPGDGWRLTASSRRSRQAVDVAARPLEAIVHEYLQSYGADEGVTQSAVDLTRIDDVAKAVDALSRALRTALADPAERGAIIGVRGQVQGTLRRTTTTSTSSTCARCSRNSSRAPPCGGLHGARRRGRGRRRRRGRERLERSRTRTACRSTSPSATSRRSTAPSTSPRTAKWDEFVDAYLAALRRVTDVERLVERGPPGPLGAARPPRSAPAVSCAALRAAADLETRSRQVGAAPCHDSPFASFAQTVCMPGQRTAHWVATRSASACRPDRRYVRMSGTARLGGSCRRVQPLSITSTALSVLPVCR